MPCPCPCPAPPRPCQVFSLFDKLCLLSDGNVVYFGDAARCEDMFSAAGLPVPAKRNPADHYLHCINRDFAVGVGRAVAGRAGGRVG